MNTDLFQRSHNYAPMLGPLEDWPPGSPEWAERLGFRIKLGVEKIEEQGIDRLIPWIELALATVPHPWEVWPTPPCRTPDRYFEYAADVVCDDLAKLIAAYKGENHSLVRALRAAKGKGEGAIGQGGRTDLEHPADSRKLSDGGVGRETLLRRLSRKRPDLLEAYERGEFPTPTAAARAAGFKVDTPPLQIVRRAWKRMSPEDRETFLREVT